jgi:hypothetical protein
MKPSGLASSTNRVPWTMSWSDWRQPWRGKLGEGGSGSIWAVLVMGWTQTQAAIAIRLNVGTVNHIVHGRRFPHAYPVPMPGF